jgi:hypothetical protein
MTTRMNARSAQRGMVLVITLLVALGLSLLGAIVIENTRTDTATAGHVRQAELTGYVAEVGTMLGMRTFALNYSVYRTYMRKNNRYNYVFHRTSFDTGAPGAPVSLILAAGANPGSTGYDARRPEYSILIDRPYEFGDAPGFSVSGTQGVSFCFRRYTFTSAGEMDATVSGVPRADSRSLLRATSVIGPTDCTM